MMNFLKKSEYGSVHFGGMGGPGGPPLPMCSDARTMHPETTPKRVAAILIG